MVKKQICYKKNCWSTKNTVIEKAEKREEEHFGEDLNKRIIPHSHKENNETENKEEETRKSIKNISYGKKLKVNIYQNKKTEAAYDLNETYLKIEELSAKKSKSDLHFSNEHNMPEYEEFLIEKTQIGSIKVSNFYKTGIGALKKLGLIPDYEVNMFNRY